MLASDSPMVRVWKPKPTGKGSLTAPWNLRLRCNSKHTSAFPRRDSPELCSNVRPKKTEGVGNAGRPMHPQPRVEKIKPHERSHHRFTGLTRPSLRNGFNGLFRALPGDEFVLSPSSAD